MSIPLDPFVDEDDIGVLFSNALDFQLFEVAR